MNLREAGLGDQNDVRIVLPSDDRNLFLDKAGPSLTRETPQPLARSLVGQATRSPGRPRCAKSHSDSSWEPSS